MIPMLDARNGGVETHTPNSVENFVKSLPKSQEKRIRNDY
jgi:hypothetical protein